MEDRRDISFCSIYNSQLHFSQFSKHQGAAFIISYYSRRSVLRRNANGGIVVAKQVVLVVLLQWPKSQIWALCTGGKGSTMISSDNLTRCVGRLSGGHSVV